MRGGQGGGSPGDSSRLTEESAAGQHNYSVTMRIDGQLVKGIETIALMRLVERGERLEVATDDFTLGGDGSIGSMTIDMSVGSCEAHCAGYTGCAECLTDEACAYSTDHGTCVAASSIMPEQRADYTMPGQCCTECTHITNYADCARALNCGWCQQPMNLPPPWPPAASP